MSADHAALMDTIYRGQRHIYDATRKYYLFGRDRLIGGMACQPRHRVLEVACGTGRNLARIGRRWPGVKLHGFDISSEMLKSAQARLEGRAELAQGDATAFDVPAMFGTREGFHRVVISFALSMIPDWEAVIARALDSLSLAGELHIVDFGTMDGMPAFARKGLRAWLAHFHVTPRVDLPAAARALAAARGMTVRVQRGPLGYYQTVIVRAV